MEISPFFAAACYQRGVLFIQVPTICWHKSIFSGWRKTAINHRRGKNMIGAFCYQPERCAGRHRRSDNAAGQRAAVRLGRGHQAIRLIRDLPFLEWLEQNLDTVLACRPDALVVLRSARSRKNSSRSVSAATSGTGERALLNLGHTFAMHRSRHGLWRLVARRGCRGWKR